MHADRLGLVNHSYGCLFNCITACQGSWASTTALYVEVGLHCSIAVSALGSAHQLPGCECTRKRFHTPLKRLNALYISIYGHIQPYIYTIKCIYKLNIYIYIPCYIFLHAFLCIYAPIYVYICMYRCVLV